MCDIPVHIEVNRDPSFRSGLEHLPNFDIHGKLHGFLQTNQARRLGIEAEVFNQCRRVALLETLGYQPRSPCI